MPWKAKLADVRDAGNGTADVQVTFYEGVKSFTRSYNLHPEQFPTKLDFQNFVQSEAAKLDKFDTVGTNLQSLIGKDIF